MTATADPRTFHTHVGPQAHLPGLVEVIPVLIVHTPAWPRRYECLAQGHGDEFIEQPWHVQQEAVHGHGPGFMLNGGGAQDEFGQPQRRVVPGVEPGRLPVGDLFAAVQRRDIVEVAEQAPH